MQKHIDEMLKNRHQFNQISLPLNPRSHAQFHFTKYNTTFLPK